MKEVSTPFQSLSPINPIPVEVDFLLLVNDIPVDKSIIKAAN